MIKIDYITFKNNKIEIGWTKKDIGFGVLTIHSSSAEYASPKFEVETECMGENFYHEVIDEVVKTLKINSKIIE